VQTGPVTGSRRRFWEILGGGHQLGLRGKRHPGTRSSAACTARCTGLPDPLPAPTKAWANSSRIWLVNSLVATGQRVPCEQLPQRGTVAARHRGDQLIAVHRFSTAFRRQQVHRRRK
jgi:hypothetical protein